jgi:hypothetical protein
VLDVPLGTALALDEEDVARHRAAVDVDAQLGRDVGGLRSLRALVDDASGPAWRVWQTRSLLIMRRVLGDEPLDAVRAELEAAGVVPSGLDMGPR